MDAIGDKIERIRVAQKMKVKELAAISGISRVTLWKIRKKGYTRIKLDTLVRIADALNVPVSGLM